jgi:hypothetical protein
MTEKQFWFRRKRYGWGWYPANWKGWTAMLIYAVFATSASYLPPLFDIGSRISWFLIYLFIITIILVIVTWKTGESPRWQWGGKGND